MALRSIRRKVQKDDTDRSTLSLINSKIDDLSGFLINKENFKSKSPTISKSPCSRILDYQSEVNKMKVTRTESSSNTVSKGNSRYRFKELINTATENSFTAYKQEKKESPERNSRLFSYFTNYAKKTNTDTQETIRKFDESLSTQPQVETPRLTIPTEEMENTEENPGKMQISQLMPSATKNSKDEKMEKLEAKVNSLIAENSRLSQKIYENGAAYQLLRKKSVDNTKEIELQARIKTLEASNSSLIQKVEKFNEENEELASALSISQENERDICLLNNKLNEEMKKAMQMIHSLQEKANFDKGNEDQSLIIHEQRLRIERQGAEIATYLRLLEEKEKQISTMKNSGTTFTSMRGTRELIAEKFEEGISFNTEENPVYPFKKRSVSAFGRRI